MEERLWLELYSRGYSIESFFTSNNIKRVAIYAGGILGSLLYNELHKYDIKIECVMDKANDILIDTKSISIDDFVERDFDEDVLIVICLSYLRGPAVIRGVFTELYSKVRCRIISITDILMICHYKYLILPLCENMSLRPYILSYPLLADLENLSNEEKPLNDIPYNTTAENRKYYEYIYQDIAEYSEDYIREVFTQSPVIQRGTTHVHSDISSKYVNIINNIRFTHNVPKHFNKTIHIVGCCEVLGYGVDDSLTTASQLQIMLNPDNDDCAYYRVVNHGVWGCRMNDLCAIYEKIKSIPRNPNDIVIIIAERHYGTSPILFDFYKNMLNTSRNLYYNLHKEFNEPRTIPLMIDDMRLSHTGMKRLANAFYNIIKQENLLFEYNPNTKEIANLHYTGKTAYSKATSNTDSNDSPFGYFNDLNLFIDSIRHFNDASSSKVGAIVMNCNPFTNGHRHLINIASNIVNKLYIFVVEEDKSYFSFAERYQLVKDGVRDIKNVTVLASGKYIISSITFPEYFKKDSIDDVMVDASKDIEIFAKYIAPTLNITYRFIGEEPLDPITRQYNQALNDKLPDYGISVIEIPRVDSQDGNVISASRVRKLLEMGNFTEVEKLVPATTLNYLKGKYEKSRIVS